MNELLCSEHERLATKTDAMTPKPSSSGFGVVHTQTHTMQAIAANAVINLFLLSFCCVSGIVLFHNSIIALKVSWKAFKRFSRSASYSISYLLCGVCNTSFRICVCTRTDAFPFNQLVRMQSKYQRGRGQGWRGPIFGIGAYSFLRFKYSESKWTFLASTSARAVPALRVLAQFKRRKKFRILQPWPYVIVVGALVHLWMFIQFSFKHLSTRCARSVYRWMRVLHMFMLYRTMSATLY